MTFDSIITNIIVRGSISTTASFYTDSIIEMEANNAYRWAAAFHKWPMTEYMDKSAVFTNGTEEYTYPNVGFRTDSIRLLKIGDDMFEKKNFEDFRIFREDYESDDDKIFSDYGRTVYINPNCASGTIYAYGQLLPSDLSITTDTTVFSAGEPEADEAIVEKAVSVLKAKAGKLQEANDWELKARTRLEEIWKRIQDEQHAYQTKDRGMFKRIDIVEGELYEEGENPLQF